MITLSTETLQHVRELCARYAVARLELTGSAARDDFDVVTSDFDFLVEFLPGSRVSALTFVELSDALEDLLGRPVDLIELRAVENPVLREAFIRDKVPVYEAA